MTLRTLKLVMGISGCLLCLAMFLAYVTAPHLGSLYLTLVAPFGNELPRLTSGFSLPMLRVHPDAPSLIPIDAGWVSLVWGFIITMPLVVTAWSLTASNVVDCLARWVAGLMLYLPVVMCLAIVVISALIVSLSHMG